MPRITLFFASIVLALAFAFPARAEIATFASAINKAGHQRMLTQRMMKAYSMIGIDVNVTAARAELDHAVSLFDAQLAELTVFAPNDEIRAALDRVQSLWAAHKQRLLKPVTRENAVLLLRDNTDLLAAVHKVVLMLEDAREIGVKSCLLPH